MILLFLLQVFHPLIYANIFRLNPIHSENIQHLLAAKYRVSIFNGSRGLSKRHWNRKRWRRGQSNWSDLLMHFWKLKRKAEHTYFQCFFHLSLLKATAARVEALALNLWVGREKCPVVLLIPICGSFCCHLRFKGVFPPYLFIKSIPIRQQIIPQKPRVSLYFRPKMQRDKKEDEDRICRTR